MTSRSDVSSLVVLTVVADKLKFLVTESDGRILSLSILDFASGEKGEMEVVVESEVKRAEFFFQFFLILS